MGSVCHHGPVTLSAPRADIAVIRIAAISNHWRVGCPMPRDDLVSRLSRAARSAGAISKEALKFKTLVVGKRQFKRHVRRQFG